MSRKNLLAITLFLISALAFIAYLVITIVQPRLPTEINSSLILVIAAFVGVATFLAAVNEVLQLVEKIFPTKRINDAANLINEIQKNLDAFRVYWERVVRFSQSSNEVSPTQWAKWVITLPLPEWKDDVWEAQRLTEVKSLGNEQIQQVQDVYDLLKQFSTIYCKLQELWEEQQANLRAGLAADGGEHVWGIQILSEFDKSAPMFWNDLGQIAQKLITQDNPLKGNNRAFQ